MHSPMQVSASLSVLSLSLADYYVYFESFFQHKH